MVPGNAAPLLCELYCDGCFPLALFLLPFCDFFPVHFPNLVKKCNHSIDILLSFGQLVFLACEAGCKPDVFEGGSVPFFVDPCGSSSDVAMHTRADPFVITSAVHVACRHDPTIHFCQLGIGADPRQMFRWGAKQKPWVDLSVAGDLKLVVVVQWQEPVNCWDGRFIGRLRVFAFRGHCR